MPSLANVPRPRITHKNNEGDQPDENAARVAAAILIQRLWRGRTNIAKDEYLNTDVRWEDAAKLTRLNVDRRQAFEGRNSPRARWRRAVHYAILLRDKGTSMLEDAGMDVETADKHLEVQHWLELIDGKHRYGSNLKVVYVLRGTLSAVGLTLIWQWYHRRWQDEDTKDNFFKWLDDGCGKDLSLDECPREQLEKERIAYLSAEQRLNYLVVIDKQGRLLWAKNNQPIDTTANSWKDAGEGQGIVPESMPKPSRFSVTSGSDTSSSLKSQLQANAATHYAGGKILGKHSRWKKYFTLRGAFEKLLRKTVQRNTWIYVSDKNFNIFIGIKETGAFQHSSFTYGGVVTSAGLISVKKGLIYTLSPLSGHYRTSLDHFHKFVDVLQQQGVDTSKVRISKAEAALWGIEHLAKIKNTQGRFGSSMKKTLKNAPDRISQLFHNKSNLTQ